MRWGLPKMEVWSQHVRRGTRRDFTNVSALDSSTTFFSLLPRLMTAYVEENEVYFARGISPLTYMWTANARKRPAVILADANAVM